MNEHPSDNAPRYVPGAAHVESWFLRANHPTQPKAIWLKATLLSRPAGPAVAEAWCSLFDGERGRARGHKATVPIAEAQLHGEPLELQIAGCTLHLGPPGAATGAMAEFSWALRWERLPGPLGQPLCLLPTRRLIDAPLPKNKLLTPAPALRVSGRVTWGDETWTLDRWLGMQGHNWGQAHSPEYAWGQCHFTDDSGDPFCTVEAASGRILIGGRPSPILALMTIRRGDRVYRFDRLLDLWNRRATLDFPDWLLHMKGPHGAALLSMRAHPERMVCLGYEDPSGRLAYCLNSKLAAVSLRVEPPNEEPFVCTSAHGGALEFLQPEPAPQIPEVV